VEGNVLRKASFGVVLGAIASPASATLLMYEPFDYEPPGTELSAADGTAGWLKVAATTGVEPLINAGSLTYAPLPFAPTGNKIVGDSAGSGVLPSTARALNGQPWTRAENATMYYSLLLDVSNVAGLSSDQTNGAFIAGFRNQTGSNGLAAFEGGATLLLRQTAAASGKFNLGIGLTNQSGADRVFDTTQFDATTGPLLLVASYQFVSGGNDIVKLWVNPDPASSEAANAAALKASKISPDFHGLGNSATAAESANARVAGFFFRNNGGAPDGWAADELRISNSWDDLWTTTVTGVWLGGSGNWSDTTKWSGGVIPNAVSIPTQIDNGNAAASAVTLDQDATARTITVNAGDMLDISTGRTLTLDSAGTTINGVVSSSGTINAPAVLLNNTGGIGTHSLIVSGSAAELHYNAGTINATSIQLTSGGKMFMSAGGNKTLKAANVTIGGTSKFDLADNKLIITNGTAGTVTGGVYSGVQGDVQRASNFGAWDGFGLTTSMPDAVAGLTTIGVATGEQVRGLGATDTDTFGGETITGASVIAMYTYAGDANLDGTIDGGDYGIIDNFVQVPGADGYANGDFNYDGVIDGGDYGIIDNNVQAQGAPFPTSGVAAGPAVTAVPEPASALALASVAASLLMKRRRRTDRSRAPLCH
jgi:hypothetical protein